MPRFYLDLHECGLITLDEHGFEFPDIDAARASAFAAARSIMAAEVQEGRLCLECRIEMRAADQQLVMTLPFSSAIAFSATAAHDGSSASK